MALPIIAGFVVRAAVRYAIKKGAQYAVKRAAQKALRRQMKNAIRQANKRLRKRDADRKRKCKNCKKLKNPCQLLSKGNPASKGPYRGGSYGGTKAAGIESHHIPSQDAYPKGYKLSKYQGVAIQMDPMDHAETASHGRGRVADRFRASQKSLIKSGNYMGAFAMDVADIMAKFPDGKYSEAIAEATAYMACLKKYKKIR